ncbi:MAG: hypothetical protein LQ351_007347 [Letrouitia transgressa]|nr:MAG: hypothetical protein LQ351_007347 [Letrouitia transgressa]
MQVDKPFTGISPIKYIETPAKGSMELGVVGYPGDLSDPRTGEKGAYMYEMFLPTDFDLATQADTMLEYQIDTFGVLRRQDLVSIGAHVYGGTYNSASVIGKYGNPYQDYIAAFGLPLPDEALNLIPVTGNTSIAAPVPAGFREGLPKGMAVSSTTICEVCKTREVASTAKKQPVTRPSTQLLPSRVKAQYQPSLPNSSRMDNRYGARYTGTLIPGRSMSIKGQMTEAEEEGFMDILKKAASIGAPLLGKALNTALPIALGPIGAPVGALAGFALNAAGKLAAESADAESALTGPGLPEGAMERAIMAEAALSTIQSMELDPELEESIFSDMKATVMKALPIVRKAAPHVMGAVMEPALRIALDSLHKYNARAAAGAESFEDPVSEPFRPGVTYSAAIDQPVDRNAEAFLGKVSAAMQQTAQESAIDGESEEGFFDVITAGIRFAGQGVSAIAQHGLPILVNALSGAEAFEAESASDTAPPQAFSADVLAHRAIVAEAALQAVMKVPAHQLEEEGFFDFVSNAVKTIAPVAMKMAPGIAAAIHPTVGKIVKGVLGQESAIAGPQHGSMGRQRLSNGRHLTAKRSLASLRDHEKSAVGEEMPRLGNGTAYYRYTSERQNGY